VKPGQLGFFKDANPNVGFDYDCSRNSEREFNEIVDCGLLAGAACTGKLAGFYTLPVCGQPGQWGKCKVSTALLCVKDPIDTRPMRCH